MNVDCASFLHVEYVLASFYKTDKPSITGNKRGKKQQTCHRSSRTHNISHIRRFSLSTATWADAASVATMSNTVHLEIIVYRVQVQDRFKEALVHESNTKHNALIDNTFSELDTILVYPFQASYSLLNNQERLLVLEHHSAWISVALQ